MKKIAALFLCFSIMSAAMTGCSKDEFMDISRFTDNYNSLCGYDAINLQSYIIEGEIYSLPISDGGQAVLLSAVTDDTGYIEEIRITLSKTDEKGKSSEVSQKQGELFLNVIKNALESYTYSDSTEAQKLINEMKLNKLSTYSLTGELTAQKGYFYYVFYSTELVSMFRIFNIHLHPIETTEKPESRPAFGNTTNIRSETVPLK